MQRIGQAQLQGDEGAHLLGCSTVRCAMRSQPRRREPWAPRICWRLRTSLVTSSADGAAWMPVATRMPSGRSTFRPSPMLDGRPVASNTTSAWRPPVSARNACFVQRPGGGEVDGVFGGADVARRGQSRGIVQSGHHDVGRPAPVGAAGDRLADGAGTQHQHGSPKPTSPTSTALSPTDRGSRTAASTGSVFRAASRVGARLPQAE